jgi:hypothetical protein
MPRRDRNPPVTISGVFGQASRMAAAKGRKYASRASVEVFLGMKNYLLVSRGWIRRRK